MAHVGVQVGKHLAFVRLKDEAELVLDKLVPGSVKVPSEGRHVVSEDIVKT